MNEKIRKGKRKRYKYSTRRTRMRLYFSLMFFISLFIGLGYAYLQSSLSINGTTKISSNSWNVRFKNLQATDLTKVSIVNNTSVSLTITLSPGDSFEYTVDAAIDVAKSDISLN